MTRLSLVDSQSDPTVTALAQRIRAERGGKLLKLYQVLLHSPAVAEVWLDFFTVIRQRCALPAKYRELAILLIAKLNGASYEFEQHVPFALSAGLNQNQLDAVGNWRGTVGVFDKVERAVLLYTDTMTKAVQVPDDVFSAVRQVFNEKEVVELTATIAGYNMVSRFLEAMQIAHE
jgi:alkylhydroperoxidase family enzyme